MSDRHSGQAGHAGPTKAAPEPQPRATVVRDGQRVNHAKNAEVFLAAPQHQKMHDQRLWDLRRKRDGQMHQIPEWEALRELASAIKEHTLAHLDEYLEQFEQNALANG